MFKGLLNNNQSDYHSFSTEDSKAHKLGIISYSVSSLPDYLKNIEEKPGPGIKILVPGHH